MVDAVETMAYAGEVPWHGLGTEVSHDMTDEQMLIAAGLNWKVAKVPLTFELHGESQRVPSTVALVRETDHRLLSLVGKDWKPVQNKEAMRFFRSFVEAGEATMETAGSLHGGRVVWGMAKLGVDFKVGGTDKVEGRLLLASYHESGHATVAKVVAERVVCANTLAVAMREASRFESRFVHRAEFDPMVARDTMGLARQEFLKMGSMAEKLASIKMSFSDAMEQYIAVWQPEAAANDDVKAIINGRLPPNRTVAGMAEAYERGVGAVPGSAWGVLNGATYFLDHVGTAKTADARLDSSWLGTGMRQKQKLVSNLELLAA